nr:uncharacterized protein LOC115495893 [Taeniopygia guttata]
MRGTEPWGAQTQESSSLRTKQLPGSLCDRACVRWRRTRPTPSPREVEGYKEPSDWVEFIGQEHFEEEDSLGQELSEGNGNKLSSPAMKTTVTRSWLKAVGNMCGSRVLGSSAYCRKRMTWDELSVLQLPEQEDREQRLGCSAEGGLPVPVPRDGRQAFEPCPQVPFCARPPHKPVPALHSCSSPSAPQLGAKGPCKKSPSHARWALWVLCSLFCCPWPCLAPLPED